MTSLRGDYLRSLLVRSRRLQFRLIHLFYAVTVVCSALVVFEPVLGCLAGASAVWVWAAVLANRRPPTLVETLVIVGITMVLISLTFPAVGTYPPPSVGGRICSENLRRIGIALQNYHARFGLFPPAFVGGDDGRPKHSWRVLILPFLGEQALYDAYDFREPWNGPRNRQLAARMPDVFRCPGEDRETRRSPGDRTRYLAVVGPHAAWLGYDGALRPFRHIRGVHDAPKQYKFRSLAGLVLFVGLVLLPLPSLKRSWRNVPCPLPPSLSQERHAGAKSNPLGKTQGKESNDNPEPELGPLPPRRDDNRAGI